MEFLTQPVTVPLWAFVALSLGAGPALLYVLLVEVLPAIAIPITNILRDWREERQWKKERDASKAHEWEDPRGGQ